MIGNGSRLVSLTWVLGLVACGGAVPVQKPTDKADQRSVPTEGSEKQEATKSEDDGLAFADAASDGRPTRTVKIDVAVMNNTNLSSLRDKSVAFWGVSGKSSVTWLNTPSQVNTGRTFTNFQEALTKSDAIEVVKRLCADNFAGLTIKACLESVAAKGGLFFEPKTPLAVAGDNDANHIRNYLDNAWGIVSMLDGTTPMYAVTCASCHVSMQTLKSSSGGSVLTVDVRGNNSAPDPLDGTDGVALFDKWSANLDNPADPLWGKSSRMKAAGLLAAQAKRWQTSYGASYHATTAEIKDSLRKGSVVDGVDTMWLYAYLTSAAAAHPYNAYGNRGLDDASMMAKTERVSADVFLPGQSRAAIAQAIFSNAPLDTPHRPQRSQLISTAGDLGPSTLFSFRYLKWNQVGPPDAIANAQHYLSGATAFAAPFPSTFDADLANAWYPGTPVATVKSTVYNELPRMFPADYGVNSRLYHLLRVSYPSPVPASLAPKLKASKAEKAAAYVDSVCQGCHVSAKLTLTSTTAGYSNCAVQPESYWTTNAPCKVVADITQVSGYNYLYSPATDLANKIGVALATPSSAYNGLGITDLAMNNGVAHDAARAPLLRWQGLQPSGYASFNEFLKKTRHGAKWAVLSPTVTPAGTQIRTGANTYNVDINGDGIVSAQEPLSCAQTATFFVGGVTVGCQDLLKSMGYRPRLIGASNIFANIHANIKRPADYLPAGTTQADIDDFIASVSTYLFGLRTGALLVESDVTPGSYKYVGFYSKQPQMPEFSVPSGNYASAQTVSMAYNPYNPGITIYYTTDGTLPTTASLKYTGPITVSSNMTINATAVMFNVYSAIGSATYTFNK